MVALLHTSESTIRRDLDELEDQGRLRRVHGGAESLSHLQTEESIQQKSVKNVQEKQKLAHVACQLIDENDVIFLDAGTTTEMMIAGLEERQITVVTNSIHHASKLVELGLATVIIGGNVKQTTDASVGAVAISQLSQLNFDKAFLGMNGVDEHYFTTPDVEEAAVKKIVIDNTKDAFVLVDASKLGAYSFVKVAPVTQAHVITTASDSTCLKKIRKRTRVIEA